MTATTIFVLIIVAAGAIAAVGIIAVALRRKDSEGAVTQGELDRSAVKAERARREVLARSSVGGEEGGSVATIVAPLAEHTEDEPRIEISEKEYGVTRRKFFTRALGVVVGLVVLQGALASLAFLWPKVTGGFGAPVKVGSYEDLKAEVLVDGRVIPSFIPAAQSWIVPFELSLLPGSSFEATPFVVAGGEADGVGLMALWQRCPHLGCRVPECISSQGFECPCHGSKFNAHGEYEGGPAARNMDRFAVSIDALGELVVDTGNVVQTARSRNKTASYPQGPFCI